MVTVTLPKMGIFKGIKLHELPDPVYSFIMESKIGHLSTTTPTGRTVVTPVAYYFDGRNIYFGTPKNATKLKFLKKNPNVSFTVDNGKLMKEALGMLIQGKAEIYDTRKIITSFKSVIPTIFEFSKKYPELVKFYLKDVDELPDERKFYKYRLIRINPTKILYWIGYQFGRITLKTEEADLLQRISDAEDPVIVAKNVKDFLGSLSTIDSELSTYGEEFTEKARRMGIDVLEYEGKLERETTPMDVFTLFNLSDALRKTAIAITRLGEATAEEVAAETRRTKAIESSNLNSLTRMNYIKKKKEGNETIFYLEE